MINCTQIKNVILTALSDANVDVMNPAQDGLHFEATVVSPSFVGKSLVQQHQMVMTSLQEYFQSSLHALSLKTCTPEEWRKKQK